MGYRRIIDCDQLYEDDQLFEAIGNDGVLLYIRLWSLAEVWGGLDDNPKSISRQSGALNLSCRKVEKIIKKLISMEKIFPYELDGKKFLWLKNLPKHQKMAKIPQSKLPLPAWIDAESHLYDSKICWTYSVLDALTPSKQNVGRMSEESLPNDTKQSKTKQNKNKDKKKSTDSRQNIPGQDQGKAVPLTGEDSFFLYLEANARKNCQHCKGTGLDESKDMPCQCVMANLERRIKPLLEGAYETIKARANPRCLKCIGFGVVSTGDSVNQCDCSKPSKPLRAVK